MRLLRGTRTGFQHDGRQSRLREVRCALSFICYARSQITDISACGDLLHFSRKWQTHLRQYLKRMLKAVAKPTTRKLMICCVVGKLYFVGIKSGHVAKQGAIATTAIPTRIPSMFQNNVHETIGFRNCAFIMILRGENNFNPFRRGAAVVVAVLLRACILSNVRFRLNSLSSVQDTIPETRNHCIMVCEALVLQGLLFLVWCCGVLCPRIQLS